MGANSKNGGFTTRRILQIVLYFQQNSTAILELFIWVQTWQWGILSQIIVIVMGQKHH
jgi:hypothetical protein